MLICWKMKVDRTELTPVETIINADIAATTATLTTVSKTDTGVSAVVDCGMPGRYKE